jgi:hypothetical protein
MLAQYSLEGWEKSEAGLLDTSINRPKRQFKFRQFIDKKSGKFRNTFFLKNQSAEPNLDTIRRLPLDVI